MSKGGYKIIHKSGMYYVSFAVVDGLMFLEKAEEYIYRSARNYYYGKQCGFIEIEFLL